MLQPSSSAYIQRSTENTAGFRRMTCWFLMVSYGSKSSWYYHKLQRMNLTRSIVSPWGFPNRWPWWFHPRLDWKKWYQMGNDCILLCRCKYIYIHINSVNILNILIWYLISVSTDMTWLIIKLRSIENYTKGIKVILPISKSSSMSTFRSLCALWGSQRS